MKVDLTFDLADPSDFRIWARIAATMTSGEPPVGQGPKERPKIQPAPEAATVAATAPAAPAPAPTPAPTPAPAATTAPVAPAPAGNGAIPSVQELREALSELGATSSPGDAADFLRLKIGSPNLSSIPEDKRVWAFQTIKQEIASRAALA